MLEKEQEMSDVIKIATFNIKRDFFLSFRNGWKKRKEMVGRIIRESGASVIGVQEMMPYMKEDLKEMLPEYDIFGWGRTRNLNNEHTAIIVKRDAVKVEFCKTFWLSKNPEKLGSRAYFAFFPRICTMIEVKLLDSGRKIRVFNTHFDHICGPARVLGVKTILSYMETYQKEKPMPLVLMGDLNSSPTNRAIGAIINYANRETDIRLRSVLRIPIGKKGGLNTFHHFKGKTTGSLIDYIFVSPQFRVLDAYIDRRDFGGYYPSDHYPIVSTLAVV